MHGCDICCASFKSKNNLKRHQLVHSGVRRFQCKECKFAFKLKSHLKEHMVIHTGIKPYVCEVCQASFARKQELEGHMLIHTGERPFTCDLCGVTFRKKCGLNQHTIGLNETKYQCTICLKFSGRQSCMQKHIHVFHTDKSPDLWQCATSSVAENSKNPLTVKDELKVPTTDAMTSAGSYECGICETKFTSPEELEIHVLKHSVTVCEQN